MLDMFTFIWDFDWSTFLYNLFQIGVAYLLSLPIALDREMSDRPMGLRTFPLVAVASCAYVLVANTFIGEDSPDAKARIMQGLMTGIGFIGGGALIKKENTVKGTTTAVSLWTTGVMGAAVGHNRFEIAIVITLVDLLTLRVITPIKRKYLGQEDPEDTSEDVEDSSS